ncbi:unnamed protein product [Heterobilharzia americana]|nr:unnamed protein product [Heterobilharzia americana]
MSELKLVLCSLIASFVLPSVFLCAQFNVCISVVVLTNYSRNDIVIDVVIKSFMKTFGKILDNKR